MTSPITKIQDLDKNISEIKSQKLFRFCGYILIPLS